jgi:hypothetical protein
LAHNPLQCPTRWCTPPVAAEQRGAPHASVMTFACSERQGIPCRSCPKNRGLFRVLLGIYGICRYRMGIDPISTTISCIFDCLSTCSLDRLLFAVISSGLFQFFLRFARPSCARYSAPAPSKFHALYAIRCACSGVSSTNSNPYSCLNLWPTRPNAGPPLPVRAAPYRPPTTAHSPWRTSLRCSSPRSSPGSTHRLQSRTVIAALPRAT